MASSESLCVPIELTQSVCLVVCLFSPAWLPSQSEKVRWSQLCAEKKGGGGLFTKKHTVEKGL